MKRIDCVNVFYFSDIYLEKKVDKHFPSKLHVCKKGVDPFYDLNGINSDKVGVYFIH